MVGTSDAANVVFRTGSVLFTVTVEEAVVSVTCGVGLPSGSVDI